MADKKVTARLLHFITYLGSTKDRSCSRRRGARHDEFLREKEHLVQPFPNKSTLVFHKFVLPFPLVAIAFSSYFRRDDGSSDDGTATRREISPFL